MSDRKEGYICPPKVNQVSRCHIIIKHTGGELMKNDKTQRKTGSLRVKISAVKCCQNHVTIIVFV